jgi:methylmalonyl-CoA/ethylmalonyl-CoA epimerase
VDDIRVALANLRQHGVRLIDEEPKHGAGGCLVAFVHPSSTGGVLLELVQPAAAPGLDHRSSDVSDFIEEKLTG